MAPGVRPVDHQTTTYLGSAAKWPGLEGHGDLEQVPTSTRPCSGGQDPVPTGPAVAIVQPDFQILADLVSDLQSSAGVIPVFTPMRLSPGMVRIMWHPGQL